MQDVYEWYIANLDQVNEMGPRTVGAALRPKPIHVEPPTPEKKDGGTRSIPSHYGVDGLYYVDPFMVKPVELVKHFLRRTFTTVGPNIERTMEGLEQILPRIVRLRGL